MSITVTFTDEQAAALLFALQDRHNKLLHAKCSTERTLNQIADRQYDQTLSALTLVERAIDVEATHQYLKSVNPTN